MQGDEMSSGGGIPMNEASQGFQGEPQEPVNMTANANANPTNNHAVEAPVVEAPAMAALQSSAIVAVPTPNLNGENESKKKRGRPRKYGPGSILAAALSPMPISAAIPISGGGGVGGTSAAAAAGGAAVAACGASASDGGGVGDFTGWKQQQTSTKSKPFQPLKKAHKVEIQGTGDQGAFLVGADFTSHMITVNAGEDVAMKVQSLSQEGSRAVCVLSAIGTISNVTLRQPTSSGGTITYEGRFEILSLSGSFMPTENGTIKSRSGGLSVSFSGPDGRVFGGSLAGLLIAANPVQVVVGSFLPGNQAQQKVKKRKMEPEPVWAPSSGEPFIYNGGGQTLNFSSPPLTHNEPLNSTHDSKDADTDNNLSSSSFQGDSGDEGFEI